MANASLMFVIPSAGTSAVAGRVRLRFYEEASDLIIKAVKDILGTAGIYQLTTDYSAAKTEGKTQPPMKSVAGKAADQPLILTGEHIYNVLDSRMEGDTLIVGVPEGSGFAEDGFDVADFWEDKAEYLEKALDQVTPALEALFDAIINEELALMFA